MDVTTLSIIWLIAWALIFTVMCALYIKAMWITRQSHEVFPKFWFFCGFVSLVILATGIYMTVSEVHLSNGMLCGSAITQSIVGLTGWDYGTDAVLQAECSAISYAQMGIALLMIGVSLSALVLLFRKHTANKQRISQRQ